MLPVNNHFIQALQMMERTQASSTAALWQLLSALAEAVMREDKQFFVTKLCGSCQCVRCFCNLFLAARGEFAARYELKGVTLYVLSPTYGELEILCACLCVNHNYLSFFFVDLSLLSLNAESKMICLLLWNSFTNQWFWIWIVCICRAYHGTKDFVWEFLLILLVLFPVTKI